MLTVRFASVSVCRCGCGGVTFGNCGSQKYQRPVPEVVLATQMSYKKYSTKSNDRLVCEKLCKVRSSCMTPSNVLSV